MLKNENKSNKEKTFIVFEYSHKLHEIYGEIYQATSFGYILQNGKKCYTINKNLQLLCVASKRT